MPFNTDPDVHCAACPDICIEDRRVNRVRGRSTEFRLRQLRSAICTYEDIVPGTDYDPDPDRTFAVYLDQMKRNFVAAGARLFGTDFTFDPGAMAKVQGDLYQMLQAAALWNATARWNTYMDTGAWTSAIFARPENAVPTPLRKIAVVPLPRGYDSTQLFQEGTRNVLRAHEAALTARNMELGMSSPDIVGVRLPDTLPPDLQVFTQQLEKLDGASISALENAYTRLAGKLEGHHFLFAISTKRSVRSDRLYQPLFEANVLKYLIQDVLQGATFKFYAHFEVQDGADAERRYKAPSLRSLLRGGEPARAIDRLYTSEKPRETAQIVLDDYPLFLA